MEEYTKYRTSLYSQTTSNSHFIIITIVSSIFFCSIVFFFFSFFKRQLINKTTSPLSFPIPTNWPILGMLPELLHHMHHLVLWTTSIQLQSGGSFMLKGPWFTNMEIFLTADPANIHHIMSKHYNDFHKGANFIDIFDALGDGIFNVDHDLWKYQRKILHATFTTTKFRNLMVDTVREKLENGLIPILERAYKEELVVDLQDLLTRFTSDVTFITIMGHDPGSLSVELRENPVSSYIHNVEQTLLMRHILPASVWKVQRWVGVGMEKRGKRSVEAAERIFFDCIAKKTEEVKRRMKAAERKMHDSDDVVNGMSTTTTTEEEEDEDDDRGIDLLTHYIMENHGTPEHGFKSTTKFLRDTLATLLSAGQDTTSVCLAWFFLLLSENPDVETKIKQELKQTIFLRDQLQTTKNMADSLNYLDESITNNLIYLHGAVCEALRLYPPVPFNHKAAHEQVVLPSGHKVRPWTSIILNSFAMGRMRSIWGDDCSVFKPERWITERGTIKHEPSHKFITFNAGPRICLGKEISLMQMKAAVSCIFLNGFRFRVVEGQSIEPGFSVVLNVKEGLRVRVFKDNHGY